MLSFLKGWSLLASRKMFLLFSFKFWMMIGVLLIFLEFLVPGLVSMFIGLGALSVALAMHYGYLTDGFSQILAWVFASVFYIFTLRFLLLKFFEKDSFKGEVDEDKRLKGTLVEVVEAIPANGEGRIRFSNSTWQARSLDAGPIAKGEMVLLYGRDNITYVVEMPSKEMLAKKKEL